MSRYYQDPNSNFNHEPNAFLMETVKGRRPGVALDYGMGQGRNSIYLASLGWEVWGFDPSEGGIAIAQKRAKELGLTLHTSAVRDGEYDFTKQRFDLILFSWTMPVVPIEKVIGSLKPGGIVVMECGPEFNNSRNAMLHLFDPLEIVRYEIVRDKADFSGRREIDVMRLVAQKPCRTLLHRVDTTGEPGTRGGGKRVRGAAHPSRLNLGGNFHQQLHAPGFGFLVEWRQPFAAFLLPNRRGENFRRLLFAFASCVLRRRVRHDDRVFIEPLGDGDGHSMVMFLQCGPEAKVATDVHRNPRENLVMVAMD